MLNGNQMTCVNISSKFNFSRKFSYTKEFLFTQLLSKDDELLKDGTSRLLFKATLSILIFTKPDIYLCLSYFQVVIQYPNSPSVVVKHLSKLSITDSFITM